MKLYSFLSLCALLTLATAGRATLLVHEGFDYSNDNTTIDGQTSTATGFTGSEEWNISAFSANVNFYSTPGSLSYGQLVTSGGGLNAFRNGSGGNQEASIAPSTAPWVNDGAQNTNEVFFSILVNADGMTAAGTSQFAFGWRHDVNFTSERYHGFAVDGNGAIGATIGTSDGASMFTGQSATGLTLASGDNFLLFRVTDQTSGGDDEFEMWLNPDLANPGTADFSTTTGLGLVSSDDRFGFNGFSIHQEMSDDSVLVDEFRLGSTMDDVMPIPEPGTLVLLGIALGSLLLFRRRK